MIRIQELQVGRYSIHGCLLQPDKKLNINKCDLQWLDTNNKTTSGAWPTWINESIGLSEVQAAGNALKAKPVEITFDRNMAAKMRR